jgi:hypothetical protein
VPEQEPGNQALDLGRPTEANAQRRNQTTLDPTITHPCLLANHASASRIITLMRYMSKMGERSISEGRGGRYWRGLMMQAPGRCSEEGAG